MPLSLLRTLVGDFVQRSGVAASEATWQRGGVAAWRRGDERGNVAAWRHGGMAAGRLP